VWLVIASYSFWGLARVVDTFLLPALNVLCERLAIPEDVASTTLMAAGCSAPQLVASIIGVFLDHSSAGVGTVVGSLPFNLLMVCAAASLAAAGRLRADGWLMARETLFLIAALICTIVILHDGRVHWGEVRPRVFMHVWTPRPLNPFAA
jgi:Ca2+/Na+ antiporter